MDDDRTQETLDSLAELFLTGTRARDGNGFAAPDDGGNSRSESDAADEGGMNAQMDGPEPYRLKPKAVVRPGGEGAYPHMTGEMASDAARGPDLRLTEQAQDECREKTITPAALVEAVVLGNLPGLSGPWLTQYAQRLADRHGAVVVVHVDDQEIDLELIEPAGQWQDRSLPDAAGDPVRVLHAVASDGASPVRTVLVHMDPLEDVRSVGRLLAVDCWTLLTGCDDAAIAAAAGLVERCVAEAPDVAQHHLGLMLMGSDQATSERAGAKLSGMLARTVAEPIEMVGSQQKIGPVNVRSLGRFEDGRKHWPAVRQWLANLAEPVETTAGTNIDEPKPVEALNEGAVGLEADALGSMTEAREATRRQRTGPGDDAGQPDANRPSGARVERAPVSEAEDRDAPADEPNLAAFLSQGPGAVVGGLALDARCPHQPGMQLLLDQAGRLHLLCRHESESINQTPTSSVRTAMMDLIAARQWVLEHFELLALTQRQCRFDHDAQPVLHLFTDRADVASGLAHRLGGLLTLHLLQRVTLGKETGWVSTVLG